LYLLITEYSVPPGDANITDADVPVHDVPLSSLYATSEHACVYMVSCVSYDAPHVDISYTAPATVLYIAHRSPPYWHVVITPDEFSDHPDTSIDP
jgi:hypothetical protein